MGQVSTRRSCVVREAIRREFRQKRQSRRALGDRPSDGRLRDWEWCGRRLQMLE